MSIPRTDQVEKPYRSATEALMACMEEFSNCEPKAVIIIHTNEEGEVVATANVNKCLALGMIETVKHMILTKEI